MTHGENPRVLIFEEDASAAQSLASLPGHPLQLDHACEAGKLAAALAADLPDILICGARQASPAFATVQSLLAGRAPEFPVITVTDTHPEGIMTEANPAGATLTDASLINNLASKKENQPQLRDLVRLAHEHGKKCIAGHLEEAGDLALLRQYGVDFIQGDFVQEAGKDLSYDFEGEIA